jgi:hypothetical protein
LLLDGLGRLLLAGLGRLLLDGLGRLLFSRLSGLLLACICLTLGGLFNAELPVSVSVVPSYALEHTVSNIRTAEADLDTPVRNYSLIPKWELRLYSQIVRDETLETYQISGSLRSSDLGSFYLASSHDQYLIRCDPNFLSHK